MSRIADSAMLLAAGLGTRLRPLTGGRAKPVVPFLNRPLLDYALEWLRRCGFREVVVNLHHRPDSIRRLYGEGARGISIRYSHEETLLGTAGGPRKALDRLGGRTLLVNGDVATRVALGPLAARHERSGALATLLLRRGAEAEGHPPVSVDGDGRILGFGAAADAAAGEPAGGADLFFAGVHLVEREILELVPPDRPVGIVDPVYRQLLDEGLPVHGVARPGVWYEIGTPGRYLRAQLRALARGDFPMAFRGYEHTLRGGYMRRSVRWEDAALREPILLDEGVRVGTAARLEGVVAGPDCRIGPAADLREAVLWARSRIGAGARLRRCIVMDDVVVEPGAEIVDAVVTADGPVPISGGPAGAATVPDAAGGPEGAEGRT